MKILMVAAEASGDLHAAKVARAIRAARPDTEIFGMAGPLMREAGVEAVRRAEEVSVMGIAEVIPALPRIFRCLAALERAAEERRPDVALLVDSPDFNLRLAKRLKRLGIPVVDFVGPTVWAWRESRVETIRARVDRMLCILPFEEAFYKERGVDARYVGNPLLDGIPAPEDEGTFRRRLGLDPNRPTVALLPGSRMMEIRRILPVMAAAARVLQHERPSLQFVLPVAHTIPEAEILARIRGLRALLVRARAAEALGAADVAVVTSGTATLEAALMQRPFVVAYRMSPLSYLVGRLMVKVKHIALPNLIAGRRLVPELLQGELTAAAVATHVRRLLDDAGAREEMLAGLREVRAKLGESGCSERVAEETLALAESRREAA